jgi:hypothetical protein
MAISAYVIKGLASYAKIVGKAPAGYDNGPNEWTFDLVIDEENKKKALANGVDPFYIKSNKEGQEFIRFSRKEVKQDGTLAKAIEIQDHRGDAWDGKTLIGNGSTLNVQFTLNEVKSKGQKRLKPAVLKVQVWDLVAYKPKGPFAVKEEPADAQDTSTSPPANAKDW